MIETAIKFETIKDELEHLRKTNGGNITAQELVDFARDPDTLSHSRFEWDNDEAAERYRLWQARQLLRVYVNIEIPDKDPISVRAYVSLPEDRYAGLGYRAIEDVLADNDRRNQLLSMAYSDLRTFRSKYKNIKELAEVNAAIDKALIS